MITVCTNLINEEFAPNLQPRTSQRRRDYPMTLFLYRSSCHYKNVWTARKHEEYAGNDDCFAKRSILKHAVHAPGADTHDNRPHKPHQ